VGEVATEDTNVEVDRLEVTGRGMAHHSGSFTVALVEWGGALVRGRTSGGGWSWSCLRATWGHGKARCTVDWAGGRPEVRGRRCGALTARANDVGSTLVTS
jgi:hypothetical protein